jgi:hypothetical protein
MESYYRLRRRVPATLAGAFFSGTSVISPQNCLPESLSVKQTVFVSNGVFGTTFFKDAFTPFLEAVAGEDLAACLVAFVLLLAAGVAVFLTAALLLAIIGKFKR